MCILILLFTVGFVLTSDIVVTKDIVFTSTKLSFGANTPNYIGHKFMNTNGATIINATATGSIRWPGGNWANDIIFNNDFSICKYFEKFSNQNNPSWTFTHLQTAAFAQKQNIDVLYQINAAIGFVCGADIAATLAANFVKNVTASGFPVKYIEVGNENYGKWETPYKDYPHLVNGSAYGTICVKVSAAIKAVLPSVQVGCVGDFPSDPFPTWMEDVLTVAGTEMDFVIMHAYFCKHYGTAEPSPWDALNYGCISDPTKLDCSPKVMADNIAAMVKKYAPSRKSRLPIMLTEYNMEGPVGDETFQVTEALFTAKLLGESMQAGFMGTTFFALVNSNHDYGMFSRNGAALGGAVYGGAYAFAMYKYVAPFGSSLLKTEVDATKNITAFGFSRDDNHFGLIIINQGEEKETLSLEGPWGDGSIDSSIFTFQAANGLDPFHATSFMWNGQSSTTEGGPFPFDGIPPKKISLSGSIDVDAASLTGIIF